MAANTFLLIENVVENIKLTESKDSNHSYTFEGTFTKFDVKNENGRFYRKNKFLPHVNALQEQIKNKKLLGELDHPQDFQIKLARASHIIEKLEYDESQNRVYGKIRLLDTKKGRDAKAIADAGVPLHISSRASGRVLENGDTEINKLYTYDLVAEPGFKQAELQAVNESLSNDDAKDIINLVKNLNKINESKMELVYTDPKTGLKAFSINEEDDKKPKKEENQEGEFVKADALREWSKGLVETIEKLKEEINTLKKETEDKDKKIKDLESTVKNSADIVEENIKSTDKYMNYLRENIENVGNYSEKYIAPVVENLFNYTNDYMRPMLEGNINYSQYLKENIETVGTQSENVSGYADYLKENLQNLIGYAEHLRENIQHVGSYTDEVIRPTLENSVAYTEKVVQELADELDVNPDNENDKENKINKTNKKVEEAVNDFKTSLLNEVTAIKEAATKKKSTTDNPLINENKGNNKAVEKPVHKFMPKHFKPQWNELSEAKQTEILKMAENYILENQMQVEDFWNNVVVSSLKVQRVQNQMKNKQVTESKNEYFARLGIDPKKIVEALKH